MSDDLMNVYKEMLQEKNKKRDITSSTVDVVSKSHPRSPIVLDFQFELFGLNPEDVKKLPIQSIEMLQKALVNLISKTKEDPMLRQALRRFINNAFTAAEKEQVDGKDVKKESLEQDDEILEEKENASYTDFLTQLSESAKAQKFNWKRLLDIDERKIQDPVFTSLLMTFGLDETLTRPQKQGVMFFIKKLAELASTNQQIALALTKLIRYENITVDEPVMESEVKKKSSELDILIENQDAVEQKIIDKWKLTTDALKEKFAATVFKAAPKAVKGFEPSWKVFQAIIKQNKLKGLIELIEDEKIKTSLKTISTVDVEKPEEVKTEVAKPETDQEFDKLFKESTLSLQEVLNALAGMNDSPKTISSDEAKNVRELFSKTTKDMGIDVGAILLSSDENTSWQQIDNLITFIKKMFQKSKESEEMKTKFSNFMNDLKKFESTWFNIKSKQQS